MSSRAVVGVVKEADDLQIMGYGRRTSLHDAGQMLVPHSSMKQKLIQCRRHICPIFLSTTRLKIER